jgi:limonene-1,2-epoxide hydrolase
MTNLSRVEAFIAAWNRLDYPAILGMMASSIRYHNIPKAPLTGIEAVREFLENFRTTLKPRAVQWIVHHIAERDGVVLTERTDRFQLEQRWIEVRVMGTFEFDENGLIRAWRDYFDLAEYVNQLRE